MGRMVPLLRIASLLVDVLVVAAAVCLGIVPVLLWADTGWGALALAIYATAGAGILAFGAQVLVGARSGRSLGQRLFRLRVVGAEAPVTRGRLLQRISVFCAMPALLFFGAYAGARVARDRLEDWGSTHPDWQTSYDEASLAEDEANERVNHTRIGSPENDRAYSERVRQSNRLGEIRRRAARRATWTAWGRSERATPWELAARALDRDERRAPSSRRAGPCTTV